ncbi:MAG: peptidylprolyl isomerase [Thermoplasmatota archaeon]
MRNKLSRMQGESDMVPVYVLIGIIVVVIAGFFALNQFILVKEEYPSDNGIFLDEETVVYGKPYAILDIERFGSIKIELNEEKAPITVANFVKLCNQGFYNGLTFHRVIPDFMIQGGDPSGDGTGGPGYTLESEADNGLLHDRGAIAMAKKGTDVRMSGSQFFIVQASSGAHHLDGEHTVFGNVVSGMEVVDSIAETATDANDAPISPVIIAKAYIVYE